MLIKDLKERLSRTPDYCYIVYPAKKICFEVMFEEEAQAYANTFGGIVFTHFPYAEYGYSDPYAFTEEWTVLDADGQIKYEVDNEGLVQEVNYGAVRW